MYRAIVAGPWYGDGLRIQTAFQPRLKVDYPAILIYEAIQGSQPAPCVAQVIVPTLALMNSVLDDHFYTVHSWEEIV